MFGKKSVIIMAIIIGILLIFIVALLAWKNFSTSISSRVNTQTMETPKISLEAGKEETKKLIEETKKIANGEDKDKIAKVTTVNQAAGSSSKEVVIVAPQSNPISVDTGVVLTRDGSAAADNEAHPGGTSGPLQSAPVSPDKLPASTIKLAINSTSISPAEFTVKAGQAVALAVTSSDSIEIFKFDDPALAAVAVGLEPRQTRVITFNAPEKAGEYIFYSDFAGHRNSGATGNMIVK
jgi:cytoskeletal protein RodZ